MKTKTSITLSEDLLKEIDRYLGRSGNRSAFFEMAVRDYLAQKAHQMNEARDLEILNQQADILNREAKDVLSYQVEL
ncbi:MAG: metal-responsive CopG/Arc/MetJ family transcriptional regulator [Candidatus Latescibacterota bacterium]|jgi:metal-responsive CopG/Arc/MetJ family transcriptional regulator